MIAHVVTLVVAIVACTALMVAFFVLAWRKMLAGLEATGFRYRVRCEECGCELDLAPREYARGKLTRHVSVTRTRRRVAALVDAPTYRYLAKRFRCPNCGEKRWFRLLNVKEAQDASRPIALRCFGGALVGLLAAGFVLSSLASLLL